MPKLLSNLFAPEHAVYHYLIPQEEVKEKIEALLKKSGKFFSEPDIQGHFVSGDSFVFRAASGAYTQGVQFASTLHGRIIGTESGTTTIETTIAAGSGYKAALFFLALLGCVPLVLGIYHLSFDTLAWTLVLLIAGPAVCNWLAGIANETARDRYERYMDKELKTVHTPGAHFRN